MKKKGEKAPPFFLFFFFSIFSISSSLLVLLSAYCWFTANDRHGHDGIARSSSQPITHFILLHTSSQEITAWPHRCCCELWRKNCPLSSSTALTKAKKKKGNPIC
ncbi:hypothetical protein E2542_SST04270 [Spatholobus suberectus]|nr:hypothetical protein E2542_SST04270 [Spatholobus suberectus]